MPLPSKVQAGLRVSGNAERFLATIRESNRQAREAGTGYETHRSRVTDVLAACATGGSSLCVLGAGNLNDLSVERLLELFSEIHLVDVDVEAVESAVARRGLADSGVPVHGPVDLTGVLDLLPTSAAEGARETAEHLVAFLAGARLSLPGAPFAAVASTGVLTQLLQSVVDSALAPDDTARVSLALRDKHLGDLVRLTRPGGTLVLVTDVVSTTTAPRLRRVPEADLEEELASLVAGANFFTGTNPYRILALLEDDPRFRDDVSDARLLDPWLWPVTPDREHLTYAIVARRAERPTGTGLSEAAARS